MRVGKSLQLNGCRQALGADIQLLKQAIWKLSQLLHINQSKVVQSEPSPYINMKNWAVFELVR